MADNALAPRAKTIGVLVLSGHEVELARVGALVFGNKRAFVDAPDPSLSDAVFQALAAELEKEGRFEIKRLPVQPERHRLLAEGVYKGTRGFLKAGLGDAQADIAGQGPACACDAMLVVASERGPMDPNSNQSFKGLAWVAYSGSGEDARKTMAAAYLMLFLVDPATGKVVANAGTATDEGTILHSVPVAATAWPKEMSAIDPEQWTVLLDAFRSELHATMRRPLFALGLRPSCTLHFHQTYNPPSRHPSLDTMEAPQPPPLPDGADSARCR